MQAKTTLVQFTKEEIDKIWPLVKKLVHKACVRAGGFVNEEHIKEYPNYKVCDTKIVTGKRYEDWFHYVDKIAEWAKEQGCKKMEIFSRPGYVRMFKEKGYVATHVQVEKEL